MDRQIERSNQILEDTLRMYVMDRPTKWEDFLRLTNFSYNNSYKTSIKMSPFETLYGRKCHKPLNWSHPEDRVILGHDVLQEMEQMVWKIKHNIKTSQYRKKSYADKKIICKEFNIGDHVYIRVKPQKITLGTAICEKLAP